MMMDFDFLSLVMYPELKNRREFVHDSWTIAKACENDELKLSILNDPYFYLDRNDLLTLLATHDNKMITHILNLGCMLHIKADISYKLVAIKHAQVDKNQHTPITMTDFVSILIENKRKSEFDFSSKLLFNHNYILKFLELHREFVKEDEVVKIFILCRKFRLSL